MLSFEGLGAGNWGKFRDAILRSEIAFPESMRSSAEDFEHMISGGCLAFVAIADSNYAGNIIACDVPPEDREFYGIAGIPEGSKIIYILNVVVDPEHQGKGCGKGLMRAFISAAKAKGYDFVAGHFRQNGSLKLVKEFGASEEGVCRNWDETGEDFVACCLDLHAIQPSGFICIPASAGETRSGPGAEASDPIPVLPDMDETLFRSGPDLHDFQGR